MSDSFAVVSFERCPKCGAGAVRKPFVNKDLYERTGARSTVLAGFGLPFLIGAYSNIANGWR